MIDTNDTKTSEVYELIKNKIVSMKYLPGQVLMVQHLVEELDFSRTPIREALVRLRDEGLLEASDGRKFRVKAITWRLISETFDARRSIECTAVTIVAQQRTERQLNELKRIVANMKASADSQDYYTYFAYDLEFHNKTMEFCGNTILINWMNRINDQQQRIRYLTGGGRSGIENSLKEHIGIMDALEQRDAGQAVERMNQHLTRARDDILNLRGRAMLCGIQD